MYYQKDQSFSVASLLTDKAVQKPLPLFAPYEIRNLTVFILQEKILGSEPADIKDFAWKRVYIANSVSEGLRLATEAEFDVAILDAEVGGIDSSQVASALNRRAIPLIFCTTKHSELLAGEFGMALVLRNPSPGEKLRAVLQQADPHRDTQRP